MKNDKKVGREIQPGLYYDREPRSLAASVPAGSEIPERGGVLFPTPWRIEGDFDADCAVEIRAADDTLVCEVAPHFRDWSQDEIAFTYMATAAPDLLEACLAVKKYLGNLETSDETDPITALRRKFHAPLLAKLDPAIAKATARTRTSNPNPASQPPFNTQKEPK